MIFFYSGCGNSRYVAEGLAASLNDKLQFIPDLQREGMTEYEIAEDESIGFVFPIYGWAAPKLVSDFVRSVKWKGKAGYVWFACTCGDDMGLTYDTFGKTLSKSGLKLDAAFCFVMPETYLCMPGFHLDDEAGERRKLSAAASHLPEVASQISARQKAKDVVVGAKAWLKSYIIRPAFQALITDKKYHLTENCTGCGLCSKVCPMKNITIENSRPLWHGNCTQCMACYHHCPKNAIQFATYTQGKGQYYFGHK